MKSAFLSFTIALGIILCQPTTAQVSLGRLKTQAGNAVNQAIDKKIQQEMNKAADRILDKYWERIIGKYYAGLYADDTSKNGGVQFILTDEVALAEAYTFTQSVKIQIQNFKKNGKLGETAFMTLYQKGGEQYMGMLTEDEESKKSASEVFVINDFSRNAFVILMSNEDGKSRITYRLVPRQANMGTPEEAQVVNEQIAPEFRPLGTKTIAGQNCTGYAYTQTDAENEVWVADTDALGMQSLFGMSGVQQQMAATSNDYPKGSIMELTSTDKSSGEKTVMQVVNINASANVSYTIADYPATNMGTAGEVE